MHLSLIPTTLRSVLSLMQQGEWESVEASLDFLWGILPPKTAAKMKERPSEGLQKAMRLAGVNAARSLDARDNEIYQGEQVAMSKGKAGADYCIGWVRNCINKLNEDGYLFEKGGVTQTADKTADTSPPAGAIQRSSQRTS